MNGNKENSRIVKTYVCKCGEVNRFSFETDFNFMEVRIDAHCQGCGKEISISVEKHVAGNGNVPYQQSNHSNEANGNYNNYGNGYNQPSYSAPSYSAPPYPSPSSILEPQSPVPSPEPQSSPSSGMMDFNFDALTSAAESMSPAPAPEPVAAVQDYTDYTSPAAPPIEVAEALNSLTPDIMRDTESEVPEISEPAALPLATTVIQTPAKKIIQEINREEEKDLLSCSNEIEEMNKDVTPDDQEAFIDLFGRL